MRAAFKSGKPHSKSKILSIATAGVRKSYLYKVVEKALAAQMDKTIIKRDCNQARACVYLVDAIVSLARKRFGPNKEAFSGRLIDTTLTFLDKVMTLTPPPDILPLLFSLDDSEAADKAAKKQRKKTAEFHKTKVRTLNFVNIFV